MIRLAILLTSATVIASTGPAAASPCTSSIVIATTRTHGAAVRRQFSNATDRDAACRAYAASFYKSVTTRQTVAGCTTGADISALDSEITAFNELLATRCGG
jgi:hypothetical protein